MRPSGINRRALVHPIRMKCAELRRKEVMPVFSRPYLKRNSTRHRRDPIFGVYDDEALGIFFAFFKPQILGLRLPIQ
jgi:hypothetical protein